jgi:predicted membrane protein
MNSDSDLKTQREETVVDGLTEARKGTVVTALIIIGVGVVLLLNQLGMLPPRFLFTFWPSILIVFGLVQMLLRQGRDRVAGAGLALVGVLVQLSKLGLLRLEDCWPLLIIFAGAALLWNALREKSPASASRSAASTASEFNSVYIFSGTDRKVDSKNFRGGKITAVFGGFKIDLTRSDLEGNEVVMEVNAVFGGGEVIVPETWAVVVEGAGVFGAFEDQTRRASEPTRTLHIKGAAVFGGVVIRNPR